MCKDIKIVLFSPYFLVVVVVVVVEVVVEVEEVMVV
jgi:hypothetical protein